MNAVHSPIPTTEMEVTSIRLERDLKERLKELAGGHGYQALIRDVLWDFVEAKRNLENSGRIARDRIRFSIEAVSQRPERCAITGKSIPANESMLLGYTTTGDWVPMSHASNMNL